MQLGYYGEKNACINRISNLVLRLNVPLDCLVLPCTRCGLAKEQR